jgi:hypothetical protein
MRLRKVICALALGLLATMLPTAPILADTNAQAGGDELSVGFQCLGTPGTGFSAIACTTGNWFVSSVLVTLDASDNSPIVYNIDGGAEAPYDGPFNVTGDGPHVVSFRTTNESDSIYIDIDTTAPTVSGVLSPGSPDGQNGWYITDPTIAATGSDGFSGLAGISYSLDGAEPFVTSAADTLTYTVPAGVHEIRFRSADTATNTSTTTFNTQVDLDLPEATFISAAYDSNGTSVGVSVASTDATSGTHNGSLRFSTDGGANWGDWLDLDSNGNYEGSVTMPTAGASLFALEVEVRDIAGQVSIPLTGPVTRSVFDSPPNITTDFGVAPVENGVCDDTIFWSDTDTITWPTEQGFCLVPKISDNAGVIGTVGDLDAILQPFGTYSSYQMAATADRDTAYLSQPSTVDRVSYYGSDGRLQGVRFTPNHETNGVTLDLTITPTVGFYDPSQLDGGVPRAGEMPVKLSQIGFPVEGRLNILNSGTVVGQ